jgi:proline dehydrogenase
LIRSVLLYLSRNERLEEFVLHFELARRAARRFIAGETMEEALEVVKGLNERGLLATIDHLGENVTIARRRPAPPRQNTWSSSLELLSWASRPMSPSS